MEYSESDIKTFFETNHPPLFDRIDFCLSLAYGIAELHSIDYYHRDIKPDNIFVFDDTFKIGDLGLISYRNDDMSADENGIIGPKGWISPEAMNKYLTDNVTSEFEYDCTLDYQSDIFQLGMVFWYIIQGNAPVGSIREADFKSNRSRMYPLLRTMLNHNKKRRPINIEEVIYQLKRIHHRQLSLGE
jgi:serine/threonine protein kinase